MREKKPVVDEYTYKCDVCGFTETVEVRRRPADLSGPYVPDVKLQREWETINFLRFTFAGDALDVCSRACAVKTLNGQLDNIYPPAEAVAKVC